MGLDVLMLKKKHEKKNCAHLKHCFRSWFFKASLFKSLVCTGWSADLAKMSVLVAYHSSSSVDSAL